MQHQTRLITQRHVQQIEAWIDEHEETLPELRNFVLPAGDRGATTLHLARAICRRAERRVVTLAQRGDCDLSEELVVYLNRLSDYLFVISRVANRDAGIDEVAWVRPD